MEPGAAGPREDSPPSLWGETPALDSGQHGGGLAEADDEGW